MVTEAKIKANNASNKRNTTTVLLRLLQVFFQKMEK